MALHWNVEQIEDHENLCFTGEGDDREMHPVTKALVFMTMSVGLGAITEDNADEFYARAHIIEQVHGQYTHVGGEGIYISPQDVQRHIGLYCNVADETRLQWAKRMFVGNKRGNDVSVTSDYTRNYRQSITINKEKVA